jgi:glycosyltransferase involved in cell wall biosynthesis
LKIALFLPDLRGGGAERVSLSLAKEFSARGYEVHFVLMRYQGDLLAEAERNFSVFDLKSPRVRGALKPLTRYVNRNAPDVLIASMWPLTALAASAKCFSVHRKSLKLLLVEHSVLSVQYAEKSYVHRLMLRGSIAFARKVSDRYIAVSSGVASDIASLAGGYSEKICVIHNPVPECRVPSTEDLNAAAQRWGQTEKRMFRVLTVGSFKEAKNLPLLLKAFKRSLDSVDAQLMILGDGDQRKQLEQLAQDLGVSDRVIMPGFQVDTSPFYLTADLFVLSSNREGLPTVLIEALSAGLPVVSTDCKSGPSEILLDGEFGTLVPVKDEVALSEAIIDALSRRHDPSSLKARSKDFAPSVAADKYLMLVGEAHGTCD